MVTMGKRRVEKLEDAVLSRLEPEERVRMVLTRAAGGDKELAQRIGQSCPMATYRIADTGYMNRLEDAHMVSKLGIALMDRYTFAYQCVDAVGRSMTDLVPAIALFSSDRMAGTLLSRRKGRSSIWKTLDKLRVDIGESASQSCNRVLNMWRKGLFMALRAEWIGFDAFCQGEFGLDARTLLKGFGVHEGFFTQLDAALSADLEEGWSEDELQEMVKLHQARYAEAFHARREDQIHSGGA